MGILVGVCVGGVGAGVLGVWFFSSFLETVLILKEICFVGLLWSSVEEKRVLFHCPFSLTPESIVFLANLEPQKILL